MLRDLQIIYGTLYQDISLTPRKPLTIGQVIDFLTDKPNLPPTYKELLINANSLKSKEIDPIYIERFCLAKISECVLSKYPINIAEAYAIAYIVLNKMVTLSLLHFKLGASRLLTPTRINGERVEDVEAISQFVVKSLHDAELINITDNQYVILGKQLQLDI